MSNSVSEVAKIYAKRHAERLFVGRKGHGKTGISARMLTRADLEANLAVAFELGRQMEVSLGKVKS